VNAPARILMTTDAVGGVWTYSLALSRQLAQLGHRITLVTLGPPPYGGKREEAAKLPASVELVVTDLKLEWLDPEWRDRAHARPLLLKLADSHRPDLVHINGYREAANEWPCPSVCVAHSCVWSWWEAVRRELPREPRWLAYAEAASAGLNSAGAWVAPTRAFRSRIEEIYRPETCGHVIHNGVDLGDRSSVEKEPFILASGRIWDGGKNLLGLSRVASALPWPVYIAGSGMPPGHDKSSNIHWLGEVDYAELQRWMERASIYVAPTYYEPFGLGILEAARAGCALVLSDIASLKELWKGAALQITCDDDGSLRHTLSGLCADTQALHALQRSARQRAQKYSINRTVAQYCDLYQRVLTHRYVKRREPYAHSKMFA
jgi:glycosyltransferase involved in cell wall biosynthesis